MKTVATALVFLSFLLFIGSSLLEPSYPALAWLRAFSEASLVGALADWFAVTALFRHPMGIPIPHTAIVPNNKDRFGETLGKFVQENFLSEAAIDQKLRSMNLPKEVGSWLLVREKNERAAIVALRLAEDALYALETKEIWELIRAGASSAKGRETVGDLVSRALKIFTQNGKLASLLIPHLEQILSRHESWLGGLIEKDLPWYVPGFLHERVYKKFISNAKAELRAARELPSHPLHGKLEELIRSALESVEASATFEQDIREIISTFLVDPKLNDFAAKVLESLRDSLSGQEAKERVGRLLYAVGERLSEDKSLQERCTAYLTQIAGFVSRTFKSDIASLVSDTIRGWDAKTVVEKIESNVTRDLQFIRINGTLVGGIIGLLIHVVEVWTG